MSMQKLRDYIHRNIDPELAQYLTAPDKSVNEKRAYLIAGSTTLGVWIDIYCGRVRFYVYGPTDVGLAAKSAELEVVGGKLPRKIRDTSKGCAHLVDFPLDVESWALDSEDNEIGMKVALQQLERILNVTNEFISAGRAWGSRKGSDQSMKLSTKTMGGRQSNKKKNKQELPLPQVDLVDNLNELIGEQHNPWVSLSQSLQDRIGESWGDGFLNPETVHFALREDVENVVAYNNSIRGKKNYEELRLRVDDQQPIPFIGHPEAKVWVLAMNPYYNPLEWCTFIKWDDYEARIRLQPGAKARPELRKCFEERQKLYAKSLNFSNEKDKRFYILDESMHVFEGDGNKDWTGYLWYGRHYLPDKETAYFQGDKKLVIASKELFALEYLPYPSTAFGDNYPIFRHTTFWAKLVKFALHNDKILIVRGRIMELVRRVDPEKFEEARKGGRILKFFNPQQISITRDNVGEYGARELEEYCDKLGK